MNAISLIGLSPYVILATIGITPSNKFVSNFV
uniref:Uncharacterized protein n=1 Tax=Florenciella sp. virus SA2 TaxID=3240092 RepID=A0AB39JEI7_9VIRU